jgi:hypothetical protein
VGRATFYFAADDGSDPIVFEQEETVTKIKHVLVRLGRVLASKEARGPEVALARIILGALGVKLGVNFVNYVK